MTENQNASVEISSRVRRQLAVCHAGGNPRRRSLCSGGFRREFPVKMGGVLFFKLQRFFCGKAVGFPPPPLNAVLWNLGIAARCQCP